MLMADCDAIGYVYRDDDNGDLMVSFKANESLEAGSRSPHLKGQDMKLNWKSIYKEKK
jgi:hypothetical protein